MSELFEIAYTGDPLLANVVQNAHGLGRHEAQQFAIQQARVHGLNRLNFRPDVADTLQTVQQKLAFLDALAGSVEHEKTVREIDQVFETVALPVAAQQGLKTAEAFGLIKSISRSFGSEPLEAGEFLRDAPHIEGFDESEETKLSDQDVKLFLQLGFSPAMLSRIGVFGAIKTDEYLLRFMPYIHSPEAAAMDEAKRRGLIGRQLRGFHFTNDRDSYMEVAELLEARSQDSLDHTYRRRGISGESEPIQNMVIANHSLEDLSAFDYLEDLGQLGETQLRDIYILGSIAHEVGHAIMPAATGYFEPFKAVVLAETAQDGQMGVSRYAREYLNSNRSPKHNDSEFFREDFAETIRIFCSNSNWLQANFSARHQFVRQQFGSIVPSCAQTAAVWASERATS